MIIGSVISVFFKDKIHCLFGGMRDKKLGLFGIVPACILGIVSPLCMYGTIPIAAVFSEKGMRDDWLAAFMVSSILLNPQLIIYSMVLGVDVLIVRILSCFLCGVAAGLLVRLSYRGKSFFNFKGFASQMSHDTDSNIILRLLKNFWRNVKVTGPYFLAGIILAVLFERYVPTAVMTAIFAGNEAFGVLMAATIGVPLYACGGGTIPLLQEWLWDGMSIGSATAFLITGPATKITNLGALKIVLGAKQFLLYIVFVMVFALGTGLLTNLFIGIN